MNLHLKNNLLLCIYISFFIFPVSVMATNGTDVINKIHTVPENGVISQNIPTIVEPAVVIPDKKVISPPKISSPLSGSFSNVGLNTTAMASGNSINATKNESQYNISELSMESQVSINGEILDKWITGPGLPPENWQKNQNLVQASDYSIKSLDMTNVPAMKWVYGCSPTAASMLFGYYDRIGYSNLYTGPTNGGVFPITNAVWGELSSSSGKCPMTASQSGVDGRSTNGHKDDYFYSTGSTVDPYYNTWTEHSPADCVADFMGTSMYRKYGNSDGSTTFWYSMDGSPMYDFTGYDSTSRDGMHGMRLFAESRGYSVLTNYNQYIDAYGKTYGFTYDQYKAEIDAGYPVLIQLAGHTVLGIGYSGTNQIIIHDTWDYSIHYMTWGGYYSSMKQYAVGVFHLNPSGINPLQAKFYGVPGVDPFPMNVHFYDASIGGPTSWNWTFGDGGSSTDQNPVYTYNVPGTYTVTLTINRNSASSQSSSVVSQKSE